MGRIIAIANQKGGVGKTTTSINLSAALAEKGKKVLVIDTDPQGNTTSGFGIDKNDRENTIYELILGDCSIRDCIIKDAIENVDVIPSNVNLAASEIELIGVDKKEFILKNEVDYVKDKYDFILIDTPPALGILTINALTCADNVVIPAEADVYSIEAVGQLSNTINAVKQYTNKDLSIVGILLTRYSGRAIISKALKDMIDTTAQCLNTKLFDAKIRECIAIKEAKAQKQDIFSYAGSSNAAIDYGAFVAEYLENIGK